MVLSALLPSVSSVSLLTRLTISSSDFLIVFFGGGSSFLYSYTVLNPNIDFIDSNFGGRLHRHIDDTKIFDLIFQKAVDVYVLKATP